jgi:hypothetical protein
MAAPAMIVFALAAASPAASATGDKARERAS